MSGVPSSTPRKRSVFETDKQKIHIFHTTNQIRGKKRKRNVLESDI